MPSPSIEERSGNALEWYGLVTFTQASPSKSPLTLHGNTTNIEFLLCGQNNSCQLVFEGYLYDQRQLATSIGIKSEVLSNGELLAQAYLHYGKHVFEKLRGQFLLVIWDGLNGELLAGHDAMGLHPLYYAHTKQSFLFSSNIFGLAYSELIPRKPNRLSLALSLLIVHPPEAGETHFEGINRIKPGHYLSSRGTASTKEICYWKIVPDAGQPIVKHQDVQEAFEEKFITAVERCMSRSPQGILLSGGLDSVSVAAVASEYRHEKNQTPLIACAGFNPPDYPVAEAKIQQSVAEYLGIPLFSSHVYDWIGKDNTIERTFELADCFPGPVDFWWAGANVGFHKFVASRGINRVLTGSGGDEWLGIHPAYAADLIRSASPVQLAKLLTANAVTGSFGWKGAFRNTLWREGVVTLSRALRECWFKVPTKNRETKWSSASQPWLFPDDTIAQQVAMVQEKWHIPTLTASGAIPASFYRHALIHDWINPRMFWELERQFHLGRVNGMEYLHPFHDRDLVSFCNSLPANIFFQKGMNKSLIRPLVNKYCKELSLDKQRKFNDAKKSIMKDHLQVGFSKHWNNEDTVYLSELGLIDPSKIPDKTMLPPQSIVYLTTAMYEERWCHRHLN